MNLILATSNQHKAEEFAELCEGTNVVISPAPSKIDVVEDGETFMENALKKAEAYYNQHKKPVLSDDSGLVVEALPDLLGIHTARFGGDGLSDRERAELLIEKMKEHEGEKERKAHFVCVLCCYVSPEEIFFFEGRLHGHVGPGYGGEHGFGYDPVFIPEQGTPHQTLAMQPEFKQKNSHRAKAMASLLTFFKERE